MFLLVDRKAMKRVDVRHILLSLKERAQQKTWSLRSDPLRILDGSVKNLKLAISILDIDKCNWKRFKKRLSLSNQIG